MRKIVSEPVIFLGVSVIVIGILSIHPTYSVLQFMSLFILLGITLACIFANKSQQKIFSGRSYYIMLSCITLLVELLVVSTGGPLSHFFLLALLFALAISFLMDFSSSVIFLISFIAVLLFQVLLDKNLLSLISGDLVSTLLFCITCLITCSLSYYINKYYHIKDALLEVLKKKITSQDLREKSILSNIQELIIITDTKLNIISVNDAAEKSLLLPKTDILQKQLFDVVFLMQENSRMLSRERFPLANLIAQKTSITIQDLNLVTKNITQQKNVTLTTKPIIDIGGQVDQLMFILQPDYTAAHTESAILDQIITKHKALIEDVRRALLAKGMRDLAIKTELIGKIDREIRHLIKLESDNVEPSLTTVNLVTVGNSVCSAMWEFSKALHVSLSFLTQNELEETKEIAITQNDLSLAEQTNHLFDAQTNLKWFDVLLHKLIEIVIVLSSGSSNPAVHFLIQRKQGQLRLVITGTTTELTESDLPSLYSLNFDTLSTKTALRLASGLEGVIAERISQKLKVPITTQLTDGGLSFCLTLPTATQ